MSYLLEAKRSVERLHRCTAVHVETVRVNEEPTGAPWDFDVEVFALEGFPEADCCYVWGFEDAASKLGFISVPATSRIATPKAAVRAVVEWERQHARGPLPIPQKAAKPVSRECEARSDGSAKHGNLDRVSLPEMTSSPVFRRTSNATVAADLGRRPVQTAKA